MLYGNATSSVIRNVYYPAVVQSGNRFAIVIIIPLIQYSIYEKQQHSPWQSSPRLCFFVTLLNFLSFSNFFHQLRHNPTKAMRPIACKYWLWGAFLKITLSVLMNGGGEGNRTPVRKPILTAFSERRLSFEFPLITAGSQAVKRSSFINSWPNQSFSGSRSPLNVDARFLSAVIRKRTAAVN